MEFLPAESFCRVSDVDATILQDLRYAQTENFIGAVVDGYSNTSAALLTIEACAALCKAQNLFLQIGYSLVIYDAFRPQIAVDNFMRWSSASTISEVSAERKPSYYPSFEREKLFHLGYIAAQSGHSRGSTVDVTLIELGHHLHRPELCHRRWVPNSAIFNTVKDSDPHCGSATCYPYLDDGTLDMGSSFDLFGPISHHDCPPELLPTTHRRHRDLLRKGMEDCGFRAYDQEWWHYTLIDEPFPDTYFG